MTISYERLVNNSNVQVDAPVNISVNIEDRILDFCTEPKGILEITDMLNYKDKRTVRKYLNSLILVGRIVMTIPDNPNSRFQKYVTIN